MVDAKGATLALLSALVLSKVLPWLMSRKKTLGTTLALLWVTAVYLP